MTYELKSYIVRYRKGKYNLHVKYERGKGNSLGGNHNYHSHYTTRELAKAAGKSLGLC